MNLNLESKVVLVTGGSKGIGLACAKAFLFEGARVALVSRSRENLDAAQQNLEADGFSVYTCTANLSEASEAEFMAEMVENHPMGRYATPEEIANVALFLASEKASM